PGRHAAGPARGAPPAQRARARGDPAAGSRREQRRDRHRAPDQREDGREPSAQAVRPVRRPEPDRARDARRARGLARGRGVTGTAEDVAARPASGSFSATRRPSAIGLAIWAASAVVALNAAILALDPGQTGFVALLVAVAGWCTAVLAVRRAPSLAWLAAIV